MSNCSVSCLLPIASHNTHNSGMRTTGLLRCTTYRALQGRTHWVPSRKLRSHTARAATRSINR